MDPCSGVMSSASGAVFDESQRLLHVDSDRLHAVCASNAGKLSGTLFPTGCSWPAKITFVV